MGKINVLIVDDSAVMRQTLTKSLSRSKDIEVVGTALDPYIAVEKIKKLKPDVLTLDIEMPRMDGLTFLSKLMIATPMPVIMVSALTDSGAIETIKALELGAVDFILKPQLDDAAGWDEFSRDLIDKVLAAGGSRVARKRNIPAPGAGGTSVAVDPKFSADVILPKKRPDLTKAHTGTVIAIGASTGGTEVIYEILTGLDEDAPGIVIVQHMPEKFTKAFADRVNGQTALSVKEAVHGDRLYKGIALIAPGNFHMLLKRDASGYWVEINDGLPVNRHRPSVDVLFRSTAQVAGGSAIGVLLTGMGADGSEGLLEMKEAGARTIAQDEASSTVFGMPREAIIRGAADMVKNPQGIISYLRGLPEEA